VNTKLYIVPWTPINGLNIEKGSLLFIFNTELMRYSTSPNFDYNQSRKPVENFRWNYYNSCWIVEINDFVFSLTTTCYDSKHATVQFKNPYFHWRAKSENFFLVDFNLNKIKTYLKSLRRLSTLNCERPSEISVWVKAHKHFVRNRKPSLSNFNRAQSVINNNNRKPVTNSVLV